MSSNYKGDLFLFNYLIICLQKFELKCMAFTNLVLLLVNQMSQTMLHWVLFLWCSMRLCVGEFVILAIYLENKDIVPLLHTFKKKRNSTGQ